jgi:hypothetical protein
LLRILVSLRRSALNGDGPSLNENLPVSQLCVHCSGKSRSKIESLRPSQGRKKSKPDAIHGILHHGLGTGVTAMARGHGDGRHASLSGVGADHSQAGMPPARAPGSLRARSSLRLINVQRNGLACGVRQHIPRSGRRDREKQPQDPALSQNPTPSRTRPSPSGNVVRVCWRP